MTIIQFPRADSRFKADDLKPVALPERQIIDHTGAAWSSYCRHGDIDRAASRLLWSLEREAIPGLYDLAATVELIRKSPKVSWRLGVALDKAYAARNKVYADCSKTEAARASADANCAKAEAAWTKANRKNK